MSDAPAVPAPPTPADASVRTGVDVVSIERVERLLAEFGASFRERAFTPAEQAYCEGRGDPPQHYAARWAVTEAFQKAVVDGPPVPARAVGVVHDGDRPTLDLSARARRALDATAAADGHAAVETAVSLSHDRHADRAVGQVVLLGGPR